MWRRHPHQSTNAAQCLKVMVVISALIWKNPKVLCSNIKGDETENTIRTLQQNLLQDGSQPGNDTTEIDPGSNTGTWPYLLAALLTVIGVLLFIFMAVRCRIFQTYLASYRHRLLSEEDTVSQCDPGGLEVGFAPSSVMQRVPPRHAHLEIEDDDDGFIEDNYIQSVARERRRERHTGDEDSDEELDLDQFSIG